MRPEGRAIVRVALDRVDGTQTRLDPGDAIWDAGGDPLALADVADALHGGDYIEYATESRYEPPEAGEDWKQEEPGEWHFTVARLYSRHVVEVMEVYGRDQ